MANSKKREWSELEDGRKFMYKILKCELTAEQAQFLKEYVRDMSGGVDGGEENYKKDFILTEEMEEMIDELHQMFYDTTRNWAWDCGADGETETYVINENELEIIEKLDRFFLEISCCCEITLDETE